MTEAPADQDLVHGCLRGEVGAFERIVERYERPLFNAVARFVRDREDARDILQTTFVKAFEKLGSYDGLHEFRSWLYRIAINESINFRRRRGRNQPLGDFDGQAAEDRAGPEAQCFAHEVSHHLGDALMSLSPDHRAVIVLRHYLDCSYEETAAILGIAEKTVKSRLFTARQTLRDLLVDRGIAR